MQNKFILRFKFSFKDENGLLGIDADITTYHYAEANWFDYILAEYCTSCTGQPKDHYDYVLKVF